MVHNQIQYQLHPPLLQPPRKLIHILHRAVRRVNFVIVGNIITHIDLRRDENRVQPHHIHAQIPDVVQLRDDAAQVADSVAVGVLEGRGVGLVDGGFFPPFFRRGTEVHGAGGLDVGDGRHFQLFVNIKKVRSG